MSLQQKEIEEREKDELEDNNGGNPCLSNDGLFRLFLNKQNK